MADNYNWKFSKVGGVTRVAIETGEDIAHLGELDQKMWTVLSCPVTGLEFDKQTLEVLDADKDGRIRVNEVVDAARWVCSVLNDNKVLTAGTDVLSLSLVNQDEEVGKRLYASAKQILASLGQADKEEISLAEIAEGIEKFSQSRFNGDGIITPAASEDEATVKLIESVIASVGPVADRSGQDGIGADQVEAFYAACADYLAWVAEGDADKAVIFPYGDATPAACAAVDALKSKIDDYFMRCKLIAFSAEAAQALDVSVERISGISAGDLSQSGEEIASYPLARVSASAELPLGAINPAWQAAVANLKATVLDVDFPGKETLSEADWKAVEAKLAPFIAWTGAKKGTTVEPLGLDYIKEAVTDKAKTALLDLIAQDKALEGEFADIEGVDKLLHLVRWLYPFLRNFVTFADFYDPACQAVFQAGKLYIDQRCCELCVQVTDMDSAGSIAALSGMYIAYCKCVSKTGGATMTIAAVITGGDVDDLRIGKNAVFYDRSGQDWDATIVKIIENPISVRQAFFSPYKKLARTISDRINKSAQSRDDKVNSDLTAKANTANIPTDAASADAAKAETKAAAGGFDIAKFAGIFAAIGMALGFIGSALVALVKPWYTILIVLLVIILLISGPSMFLAWRKLRRRNISPVLNVNGWAMNATALVNTTFGGTLTSIAKFPVVSVPDPYAPKKHTGRNIFLCLMLLAGIFAALYFTDKLKGIGLPYHKEAAQVEEVQEPAEASDAGSAELPGEEPSTQG